MSMLEVKDLQVYYGVIQALKGISFHVEQGEVIALIGANGAGKTTTLQTLTGIIPAKSGSISFWRQGSYQNTGTQDCRDGNGSCTGGTTCIRRYVRIRKPSDGSIHKKRQE